jgi:hypothetical protein
MSQSKAKELSGLQPLPIQHPYFISRIFALSSFILMIVNLLYNLSVLPSHDLGNWFFCGTIVAAFLLPLFRFPNKYYGILVPLGAMLAWFAALNLIVSPLVLRVDTAQALAEAANILPANAVLIPSQTTYNQPVATVGGPGVAYYYKSTNPQADYQKIHDFYKEYLTLKQARCEPRAG